ncbi:MAG: FecR domain-containing protein [Bacteriovoracaceae bacterium]|nr:FecR domain-containing protein [Bacteriovoracaceae bacterium]
MIKFITIMFLGMWFIDSNAADYKMDKKSGMAVPVFIGKVVFVKGEPVITRKNSKKQIVLTLNGKVKNGDTILTDKRSFVKVKMSMVDNSVITIGTSSTFEFKTFDFKNKKVKKSVYHLLNGKLRAKFPGKNNTASTSIEVRKSVAMGIRGTEVLANVRDNPSNKEVIQIALLEGSVDAINNISKKVQTIISGMHQITVNGPDGEHIEESLEQLEKDEYLALLDPRKKLFLDYVQVENPDSKNGRDSSDGLTAPDPTDDGGSNWRKSLNELNKRLKQNRKGN